MDPLDGQLPTTEQERQSRATDRQAALSELIASAKDIPCICGECVDAGGTE